MKIVTENAVYVQKNDIFRLFHVNSTIPHTIIAKAFKNGLQTIDDSSRYEFVKYKDNKDIEFFNGLDWIVDYNSVKDLSDDEITKMEQDIAQEVRKIVQQIVSMPEQGSTMIIQSKLLNFKMYFLRDFLLFRHGKLKMTLPEGIDYPKGYIAKEEHGIQKLMKRIFPKRKNQND